MTRPHLFMNHGPGRNPQTDPAHPLAERDLAARNCATDNTSSGVRHLKHRQDRCQGTVFTRPSVDAIENDPDIVSFQILEHFDGITQIAIHFEILIGALLPAVCIPTHGNGDEICLFEPLDDIVSTLDGGVTLTTVASEDDGDVPG